MWPELCALISTLTFYSLLSEISGTLGNDNLRQTSWLEIWSGWEIACNRLHERIAAY